MKAMLLSTALDTKKRFHAACAIRGILMSQVVVELIEQWLDTKEVSPTSKQKR